MPRHNAHIDEKLIQAGLDLVSCEGIKSLSVRKICQKAGANLGMFSYFFKDKETYLKCLFSTIHLKMDIFLGMDQVQDKNTLERLHHFCRHLIHFAFEHMYLLRAILVDFTMDDSLYQRYLEKGILPPMIDLLELVKHAQGQGFLTNEASAEEIEECLIFSCIMPLLFPNIGQFTKKQYVYKRKELSYYYDKFDRVMKELEVKQ